MNTNKKFISAVGIIAIIVVIIGAGILLLHEEPKTQTEERQVLRMAMVPAEDITAMVMAFDPMKSHLENELGMEIELFKAIDYTTVIEAMRAERIDIAFFGPFSYVIAAERANAKAIIAGGDAYGNIGVYHSILITHRDTGIRSIDDVKARSNEITISFADPASTSGHLIPRGTMEYMGIDVDRDFREIVFAGGHDASILAANARTADVSATWEEPFQRAIDAGIVNPEEVSVIWRSDGIPNSPVAVRRDMDPALIQKIQQAFVNMPHENPNAMAHFEAMWHGNKYYVIPEYDAYEFVRQVAIGLGKI